MRSKKSLCRNILAATAVVVVLSLLPSKCWAVTHRLLHQFTGTDGAQPHSELIVDNAGNLYGTTVYGGNLFCTNVGLPNGCGVVFKLTRRTNGWSETILHSFSGGDGAYPVGGLVFDRAGNLYGTTSSGGNLNCDAPHGCGTVFKLTPNSDGSWSETVLYSFSGEPDGFGPEATLVFDVAGNLYGTTASGGLFQGDGIVFELKPNSDGSWTEQILHRFVKSDGSNPAAKLTFDAAGNLYGTTTTGGPFGSGTVFKLAPNGDGNWTESVLHSFSVTDGSDPLGGVVFDSAGNLYGTTSMGGSIRSCSGRCGLVYKLSPNSDTSWTESMIHTFGDGPAAYPSSSLIFDSAGNLYGTAYGYSTAGAVFKLAPASNGKWSFITEYAFTGKPAMAPAASVVLNQEGNLFGTTAYCSGGGSCSGVIFQIIQ